jgi:tRNA pseudouridine55 synthase
MQSARGGSPGVARESMDGLIVVDKPEGPSSHDVVARVRRALSERRIGHTGTLDPMATGVLPLVLGRATRLARFITSETKTYRATVRLGVATTTHDRLGERVGAVSPVDGIGRDAVEAALGAFRGTFMQTPPAFSAKKLGGARAYDLARRGVAVTPAAVAVTVQSLVLHAVEGGLVDLEVTGSPGFYVRTLAHDLGVALGVGGHLAALRRTRSGELTERDAVPLAAIEGDPAGAAARVRPMAALLPAWPTARTTPGGLERVRRGQALRPADCSAWPEDAGNAPAGAGHEQPAEAVSVRVLGPDGDLIALAGTVHGGPAALHPRVVLV